METDDSYRKPQSNIENAITEALERATVEGMPASEIKVRIRKVSQKIIEIAIEHKGVTIFIVGAIGLTAGYKVRQRRHNKK